MQVSHRLLLFCRWCKIWCPIFFIFFLICCRHVLKTLEGFAQDVYRVRWDEGGGKICPADIYIFSTLHIILTTKND